MVKRIALIVVLLAALAAALVLASHQHIAAAPASPSYCYSTGQFLPWPDFSGYCPDGQAPFNGPGPSYSGGNHRWPDGSDD